MIWSVLHRFFGWHYVHLKNSADEIIRRVRYTGNGDAYVVYFCGHLIFLDRPGTWEVTLLTAVRA